MQKILLISFIIGITSLPTYAEEFMVKALNSWIGYSIDDVIETWGYPKLEKQIAGRHLVYWTNNQYHVYGNQYYVSGGETYCNKIFEIDKNKKIVSWQYEGNSCPNFYFTGANLVNPQNDEWKKKELLKKEKKLEVKRVRQENKNINSKL